MRTRARLAVPTVLLLVVTGLLSAERTLPVRAAGTDPKIGAAGDIACDPASPKFNDGKGTSSSCRMAAVAKLLDTSGLSAVLAVGDTQYTDGAFEKYGLSYDPSWGRVKDITHPTPGDHEYDTTGAAGYFRYFGAAALDPNTSKSYYSFDLPTSDAAKPWHVVSLNSNCNKVGGCGTNSNQYKWLVADLAAHPATCTLAFSYKGRFSSGMHGSYTTYQPFWQALYASHADLVIDGHDHDYERFAPQSPTGVADPHGIREFIVGTGGVSTQQFGVPGGIANSQYRQQPGRFGALILTLHPSSYDWAFKAPGGAVLDSGTSACV